MHIKIPAYFFGVLLLTLAWLLPAEAQQYPIRSYSIEEGLSQSVVNNVFQTRDGYIWIATEYGLNRFDGFTFESFFTEDGLTANTITYLGETPDGRLLAGSVSGISVFSQSVFSPYNRAEFARDALITRFEFLQNSLLVSTDGQGFFIESPEGITHFTKENGLPSNRVLDFITDTNGDIYLATHDGLVRIRNNEIEIINGLQDNRIHVLSFSPNNNILAGTDEGLDLIRRYGDNFQIEHFSMETGLADNAIRSIIRDDQNGVWIGTENGISYYHDGEIINYSEQQGLSNTIVISGFMDREGIMWFGTYGGGVNMFLGRYAENYTIDNGLSNNVVTSFQTLDDERTWVSTFGGGITEFSNDEFRHIRKEQGLIDNRVYTLYQDSRNRIWIGTQSGISRYQNGEFVTIEESNDATGGSVRAIRETQNGDFWIGTYGNGAALYSQSGIQRFTTENGLPDNIVMNIHENHQGEIQLATYGGLATFRNGQFEILNSASGLTHNNVLHLFEDQHHILWISTFRGITLKHQGELRTITMADGLPDHVCYFTMQDADGNYWVGTNRGIARITFSGDDPMSDDFSISTYTTESAMVSNEANTGAVYRDQQDRLWIGTVGGMTRLSPGLLPQPRDGPAIHMQNIQVFDVNHQPGSEIKLAHDQNFVAFMYSGLSYRAPSQLRYEYILEGVDSQWQSTAQRSVRYTTLPHGTHTFRVRAIDQHGIQSATVARSQIQILPPFWLRWWFILLILAALSGLIYLIYHNYKVSRQVELERVRIRIASDLHDDVGASLTEIALNTDLLRASPIPENLKLSVSQIGDLSRNIVTTMDDIVWSIDARNDSVGDLTDRMQDYATSVLTPRNIDVDFQFSGLDDVQKIPVEFRQNLYLIFKEAANNIAKHSEATQATITLNRKGNHFTMVISDNGKGIEGKGRRGGHGLKNMQLRAERIHADLHISSNNGTTIRIETRAKI